MTLKWTLVWIAFDVFAAAVNTAFVVDDPTRWANALAVGLMVSAMFYQWLLYKLHRIIDGYSSMVGDYSNMVNGLIGEKLADTLDRSVSTSNQGN